MEQKLAKLINGNDESKFKTLQQETREQFDRIKWSNTDYVKQSVTKTIK